MPVYSIENLSTNHLLGIWKLEETSLQDFYDYHSYPSMLHERIEGQRNEKRRLETLASHALLYSMVGRSDFIVDHEPSGRPFIKGWEISLTHTRGYVAAELARTGRVGIDVEYESDRVNRVREKFLQVDEYPNTLQDLLIFWCAKEAGYKFFSEQHLSFEEMKVEFNEDKSLRLTNKRQKMSIQLNWRKLPNAMLVYSLPQGALNSSAYFM